MADLNRQPVWRHFPVSSPADVLIVRRAVDKIAQRLGFASMRQAEAVLAASELAQNHVNSRTLHGRMAIGGLFCGQAAMLTIVSVDQGPGIDDVSIALMDGNTTGVSYGNGLGTVRRLSDDFAICSGTYGALPCGSWPDSIYRSGQDSDNGSKPAGTMVAASFWWPRQEVILPDNISLSALIAPKAGESFCGDGVHVITRNNFSRIVLMDVLGHGPEAAESVAIANDILDVSEPGEELTQVISHLDRGLASRRGLAGIFMKIDTDAGVVQTCGVGNISACFFDSTRQLPVTCLSGVIGQNFNCRRLMVQDFIFSHELTCVIFSDGLTATRLFKEFSNDDPPLFSSYIAFESAVSGTDDASIIVWKWLKK